MLDDDPNNMYYRGGFKNVLETGNADKYGIHASAHQELCYESFPDEKGKSVISPGL